MQMYLTTLGRHGGLAVLLTLAGAGCTDVSEMARDASILADTIWLEDLPSRTVAGTDDRPLHQVVGAAIMGDRIAVAEQGGRILILDRSGELVATAGGPGDGPGEFRRIEWIQRSGDQWVAYDNALDRITTLDAGGALATTLSLSPPASFERSLAIGALPDGAFLARSRAPDDPTPQEGSYRPSWVVHRFDALGMPTDSIGSYVGSERYVGQASSGMFLSGARPYGRETGVVLAGAHLWVAENVSARVERWDLDEPSLSHLVVGGVPEWGEVTEDEVAIMRARWAEGNVPGIDFGEILDEIGTAETFPLFGWDGVHDLRILTAAGDGEVWILHFGGVRGQAPVWSIIDEGGLRARVASRVEASILAADDGMAVALLWDDHGVERVEVFSGPW